MRGMVYLLLLAATLATAAPGLAQSTSTRPRVGLVLGGGGARGFAHLGVLKVLDELRIPIDAIAGTSMGAVVGGMMAQGLSWPELQAAFESEDWSGMFVAGPPRARLPMRRRREDREMRIDFEVGVTGGGLRLPPAVVSDARLNNALTAQTIRARSIESFDDLPIPFRAVATDADDGSMVVLSSGGLAEAIRASMAVPGAFAPEVIDGRRLVDGGMVRNVPVDVMRQMGVDVMIIVDVSTRLEDAPEGNDPLAMLMRMATVVTAGSSTEVLGTLTEQDVFLRPDLSGISSADFGTMAQGMEAGEQAARAAADHLALYSIPEAEYRSRVATLSGALPAPTLFRVDVIQIDTAMTALSPRVVSALLHTRPGDTISLDDVRSDLTQLLGYGGFQSAGFSLTSGSSGGDTLTVRPRDEVIGRLVLKAGLTLADRQRGASGWGLRTRLGLRRVTPLGGEAWGEIEMGSRDGLRLWTQLPLVPTERIFGRARVTIGRSEINPSGLFQLPIQAELTDRLAHLALGFRLGWWGELAVGVNAGRFELAFPSEIGGEDPSIVFEERSVEVHIESDRHDRADFPSSGHRLATGYLNSGSWAGGGRPFQHLLLEANLARSRGHQTLTFDLLGSTGLGTDVPLHRAPRLGGQHRLSGSPRDAIWGGYAAMTRLGWSYRTGVDAAAPGESGLFLGATVEGGQAWLSPDQVDVSLKGLRWGASVWVGRRTPIGPVRLSWGFLEGNHPGWTFGIGAPF